MNATVIKEGQDFSVSAAVDGLGMIGIGTVVDNVRFIHPTARIYHNCVIRDGVYIGEGVVIGHLVVVERDTRIGAHTTIQSQCHITAEVEIGEYCFFGPGVLMSNEKNIANSGRTQAVIEGPRIGRGVRIGAGCYIAPGVTIGDNAFIYARSFVSKNVPAGEIWSNTSGKGRASRIGLVPREEWL
jgi:UDP-3-O-[3-hydroxymyristoyl] glucosamine N-acyltransferase